MKPAAKYIGSKATRYLIGASILLLALMLFSELSCSLLGLCSNWFPLAALLGFWEMLGILTALVFASFSIRALRRSQHSRYISTLKSLSQSHKEDSSSNIDRHAGEPPPKRSSRWRDLFNQLSDDEKQKLKTIMEQHCIPPAGQSEDEKSETAGKS